MFYDLLKEAEAAALLNLSKSMLRKMRAMGTGVVKIGASVRYPAGALTAFIQERTVVSTGTGLTGTMSSGLTRSRP
jgi:hypothetical protein